MPFVLRVALSSDDECGISPEDPKSEERRAKRTGCIVLCDVFLIFADFCANEKVPLIISAVN